MKRSAILGLCVLVCSATIHAASQSPGVVGVYADDTGASGQAVAAQTRVAEVVPETGKIQPVQDAVALITPARLNNPQVASVAAANATRMGLGLGSFGPLVIREGPGSGGDHQELVAGETPSGHSGKTGFGPTTAVPIPNAALLFGSALVAFVTWSRRRA